MWVTCNPIGPISPRLSRPAPQAAPIDPPPVVQPQSRLQLCEQSKRCGEARRLRFCWRRCDPGSPRCRRGQSRPRCRRRRGESGARVTRIDLSQSRRPPCWSAASWGARVLLGGRRAGRGQDGPSRVPEQQAAPGRRRRSCPSTQGLAAGAHRAGHQGLGQTPHRPTQKQLSTPAGGQFVGLSSREGQAQAAVTQSTPLAEPVPLPSRRRSLAAGCSGPHAGDLTPASIDTRTAQRCRRAPAAEPAA